MGSVSALPLHVLAQPAAQGSTAPKAARACFPPEPQPRSKYWGVMVWRGHAGLTSLPQPSSDLLSALGTAGGHHSARQFQPGNLLRPCSCLCFRAFGHPFGRGKPHGSVELGLYNLLGKNYLCLFIDFLFVCFQ